MCQAWTRHVCQSKTLHPLIINSKSNMLFDFGANHLLFTIEMINRNERKSHSDTSHIAVNSQHRDEDLQSFTTSLISRSSISGSLSGSLEISQEHIDQIHDAFAIFDREMTGSITTEQFRFLNYPVN